MNLKKIAKNQKLSKMKQRKYTKKEIETTPTCIYICCIHFKETTKISQVTVKKAAQEIKIESSKTFIQKKQSQKKRERITKNG